MELKQLKKMASRLGIKSGTVDSVLKTAESLGVIKDGKLDGSAELFRTIVNCNGGRDALGRGLRKLDNPFVRAGLAMLGLDVDKAKKDADDAMGSTRQNTGDCSVLLDRISRLK